MSSSYEHKKKPKYPQVQVKLSPHLSDDDILGTMGNALRDQAKCSQDEVNEFYTDARRGTRSHLIATCRRWVTTKESKSVPNTST